MYEQSCPELSQVLCPWELETTCFKKLQIVLRVVIATVHKTLGSFPACPSVNSLHSVVILTTALLNRCDYPIFYTRGTSDSEKLNNFLTVSQLASWSLSLFDFKAPIWDPCIYFRVPQILICVEITWKYC